MQGPKLNEIELPNKNKQYEKRKKNWDMYKHKKLNIVLKLTT